MDCSEATTMLDELALDVLPGDQRAALLAHVEECSSCRQLLDQLSETADALLLGGPEAPAPPGFEDRVLARIGDARGAARAPGRSGRRRRQLRLPALAAAAAAAALLAIGGLAGGTLGRSGDGGESAARRLRTVDLLSTSGADVGDVSSYYGRSPWYFMQVDGALPDGTYQCLLEMDDGRTVPMGRLPVVDGQGGWGSDVSVDARRVRLARLLDSQGNTVATAQLA